MSDYLPPRCHTRHWLEEFACRVRDGWVPFGWHARYTPVPLLEFDGIDDDGDPKWERWIAPAEVDPYCPNCFCPDCLPRTKP